jgi:hypothetical protein
MTFWKFFIIILFIYIVYYSVMLLLEKMKTQKSVIPITSKRVDFVVDQPKPAMANEAIKSFEIETDEEDNEVEEPAGTGTDNEEITSSRTWVLKPTSPILLMLQKTTC